MDFTKILRLPKPELRQSEYIGYNTGIRPERSNGIRIAVEEIHEKVVVHNYGHGGGGVSLSYGACKQALEKFWKYLKNPNLQKREATVLGCG